MTIALRGGAVVCIQDQCVACARAARSRLVSHAPALRSVQHRFPIATVGRERRISAGHSVCPRA